jgi:hypothetical protein
MIDHITITHAVREQLIRHGHLDTPWLEAQQMQHADADLLWVHIVCTPITSDATLQALLAELVQYSKVYHKDVIVQGLTRAEWPLLRTTGFRPAGFSRQQWYVTDTAT